MSANQLKFYNINILKIYIAYLKSELNWNNSDIEDLFQKCDSDISILQYEDNWFDQELADTFYNAIVDCTGDTDIAYKVGSYLVDKNTKGITGALLSSFLTPEAAYKNINRIASAYSKGAELSVAAINSNSAVIKAKPAPNCDEKEYQCRNRMGILEHFPRVFGLPSAVIDHTKCLHKGDDYCEYNIKWMSSPTKHKWLVSTIVFLITSLIASSYTNIYIATILAIGLASAAFSISKQHSERNLRKTLNDQVEAMRISMNTIERRHNESTLINEINKLTSKTQPMTQLCKMVVEQVHHKMNYDRVSIFIVDTDSKKIISTANVGYDPILRSRLSGVEFNLNPENNEGFLTKVVNTKSALFIRDVDKNIHQLSARSQELVKDLNIKSLIAIPILFENEIFGILVVDNTESAQFLSNSDLELLENLANQISVAFANVKSYEKLQNMNQELEQKVAERTAELLEARDEAIEASLAKSRFLASMNHELRTPLNAIMSYSDMIEEELNESDNNSYVLEDLNKIKASGKHLLSMINNVLDLAKVEAGKMDLNIDELNIAGLIEDIVILTSPLISTNNNELIVDIDKKLGNMWSDEIKLRQVLVNLLSNAAKFTQEGKIIFKAESYTKDQAEFVSFSVKDSGIGMTEEQIGKLFKEFSQADSTTSKNYGGTGLGLAISRNFCQLMQGDISVTSKPSEGSCFTVKLPLRVESNSSGETIVKNIA